MLLRRPVPEGVPPAAYRSIVQHVHAVAKDQLDSVDTLHSYVARILPVYVEKSRQHKSTSVSPLPRQRCPDLDHVQFPWRTRPDCIRVR